MVVAALAGQPQDKAAHARKAHLRSLAYDLERLRRGGGRIVPLAAQIRAKIDDALTPIRARRLLLHLLQQAVAARLGSDCGTRVGGG